MRSRLLVTLLALAALAALPAVASARLPRLFTAISGHHFSVRPGQVIYTGDGSGLLAGPRRVSGRRFPANFGRLRWSTWTNRVAATAGTVWINDCRPDCADGHFHPHRALIGAFRVRHGRFTRLNIGYRYGGRRYVDRRKLQRFNRSYAWGF